MYDANEIARWAGEDNYRLPRFQNFEEIQLNGEDGTFYLTRYDETTKKWEKKEIGQEVQVVLLRKRRKLAYYNPEATPADWLRTTEHNRKDDVVVLSGPGGLRKVGPADLLREKFDKLKTNELFYAIYGKDQRIVRVLYKGTSLGSKEPIDGLVGLYDYLGEFGDGHVWQYVTVLRPVEYMKRRRTLFAITSERGKKLDDSVIADVIAPKMKELAEYFAKIDASMVPASPAKPSTPASVGQAPEEEQIPVVDLDEPSSASDEIPF